MDVRDDFGSFDDDAGDGIESVDSQSGEGLEVSLESSSGGGVGTSNGEGGRRSHVLRVGDE